MDRELVQEREDQGNMVSLFLHVYTVQQHPALGGERKSGKSHNAATHMYVDREVMHERARHEERERERERADSVKLSSATWDRVSDRLSLFSSQR